jgi:hypothetical protein
MHRKRREIYSGLYYRIVKSKRLFINGISLKDDAAFFYCFSQGRSRKLFIEKMVALIGVYHG